MVFVKKKKKEPKNRQIGWFWLNIFNKKAEKKKKADLPTIFYLSCYANQTIFFLGLSVMKNKLPNICPHIIFEYLKINILTGGKNFHSSTFINVQKNLVNLVHFEIGNNFIYAVTFG